MKKLLAVFALILGTSSLAQAGMMIEPYLGYQMSDVKYQIIGNPEYTDKLTGTGMGLRLGYKMLIPWFALDYTAASGSAKAENTSNYDYTRSSLGAVVGADLLIVRAWLGYGFSNDLTAKESSGKPEGKFKGTYTKLGVGFSALPLVSLNAEYQINDYKKVDMGWGAGEQNKSDVFDSLKDNSILLSVSIPFNL